jgi:hypothetical protein
MGTAIVKPSPEEDFYIIWSSIVDNLYGCGTRAEIENSFPEEAHPMRFQRADEWGTSSLLRRCGWNSDRILVREDDALEYLGDGAWFLPRKNLKAYAIALCNNEPRRHLAEWEEN